MEQVEAITVFIQQTYPQALLRWIGKTLVVVLFVLYIVLSSWGVSRLQESFQLESVIPAESYYAKHLQVHSFSAFARSWDRMSSVYLSVCPSVCNVGDL